MITFDNTSVAFAGKSNKELNIAYFLYRLMNSRILVSAGKALVWLAIFLKIPLRDIMKKTIFGKFCGGETLAECAVTVEHLFKNKIFTILDYAVEAKESETDFEKAMQEKFNAIASAKGNAGIPFFVFKVTAIARFGLLEKVSASKRLTPEEEKEYGHVKRRIFAISIAAADAGIRLLIDAEETWIQNAIDEITTEVMMTCNKEKAVVYNTLQFYRHDRLEFLKRAHRKAAEGGYHLGVKLVRGAYMEKERKRAKQKKYSSPIQKNKEATDADYNMALAYCIGNISQLAILAGTHNELSCSFLADLMAKQGIERNDKRIYFAQLYGMSDQITYTLAKEGYNVAKYVPYGPVNEVIPYLIRRAEENTSVKGQSGRELQLIIKEKNRRTLIDSL